MAGEVWPVEPLKRARSLPARAYTDPAMFEVEKAKVFKRAWLPVGRQEDWPEVGSYRAVDLFGEPLLVMRDPQGAIVTFANVCRHRSMRMLDGAGRVSAIQCPYHLWTYGLDGALQAAPFMDKSETFDATACLPKVRTETWNGWVFVCMDDDAPPLSLQTAALSTKLAHLDLAQWREVGVLRYQSDWNWKIMVENFAESYHVMSAHKTSLQPFWPAASSAGQETDGRFAELHHAVDPVMGRLTVYILFPTMLMSVSEGGPQRMVLWYDLDISAHDSFALAIRIYFPSDQVGDTEAIAAAMQTVDFVHREDIPLCAAMQRGLSSQYAAPGPLSHLEQPLWVFHTYLAERLK
ncbi:MAG: aromatic ring-hydroxylating dioxygenase subunit alpha [Phenylobacterium sp.]|jgi:phenylpropionate dioxygenase-like ring-hydroxylating dioxygenase large terminal subunit|nr:aromatic ring-hydroxylating dioxygenase subunit alpha [Phenylobacterium sp.]